MSEATIFEQPARELARPSTTGKLFKKVGRQSKRARLAGLPATLTTSQWRETVAHFHGLCAYCQQAPYRVIEHFIPMALGGGTTADNCVPACTACNMAKLAVHPDILAISDDRIPVIQRYLETRGEVEV